MPHLDDTGDIDVKTEQPQLPEKERPTSPKSLEDVVSLTKSKVTAASEEGPGEDGTPPSVLDDSTSQLKAELKESLKQQKELLLMQQEQLERQQEQQKILQQQAKQLQMQQQAMQLQPNSSDGEVGDFAEEEDDEIRMAKALAMAIAQNPHMNADQIRQLVQAQERTAADAASGGQASQSTTSKHSSSSVFKKASLSKLQGSLMSSGAKAQSKVFSMLKTAEKSITSTSKDVSTKSFKTNLTRSASARFAPAKPVVMKASSPRDPLNKESMEPSTTESMPKKKSSSSSASLIKAGSKSVSKTMKSAMGSLSSSNSPKSTTVPVTFPERKPIGVTTAKGAVSPNSPPTRTSLPVRAGSTSTTGPSKGIVLLPVQTSPSQSSTNLKYQLQDTPVFDASSQAEEEEDPTPKLSPIRITGVVWKRRSGLGKYSVSAAWERRRIVLKGTKLFYYRNLEDDTVNHTLEEDLSEDDDAPAASVSEKQTWLEQATAAVAQTYSATTGVGYHSGSGGSNRARGYLDLAKEQASVGASLGHSGAPTPFALSIKVLAQTKWKLCFDSHVELMEWLAALTDVVVQTSVDDYNAQILQANDPMLESALSFSGQLSEPPMTASNGSKDVVGGHRLWVTSPYAIKSQFMNDEIEEEEELQTDDEEDEVVERQVTVVKEVSHSKLEPVGADGKNKTTSISTIQCAVMITVNAAIVVSRLSSTSTEIFWYISVFANVIIMLCFSKLSTENPDKALAVNGAHERIDLSQRSLVRPQVETTRKLSARMGKSSTADATDAVAPIVMNDFKPTAGTTTMKIENETDPPVNKNGHVFAGWRNRPGDVMAVRSHGYLSTKKKVPSPGTLYDCAHVDIFESGSRIPDMASHVNLPKVEYNDGDQPKTWNTPDIFVISIAIPTEPPKLGWSVEDGGGFTITMYYTMSQETRDILRRVTADGYDPKSEKIEDSQKSKVNAVRLLEEWCRRAPTDNQFMARFKVVPNAQNLKEIGLPSWIAKYNGKPFLIKRPGQTGFLYRHPEKSCIEFDISLHPFPYIAKQGICFMKDTFFKKVLVTFGFLIEGRADDELPECLIGLMQLCYPDPAHAIQAEDFFSGRSPASFAADDSM